MVALARNPTRLERNLSPSAAYDEARQREDGSFRSSGVTRRAARAGRPKGGFFSQYSPYGKLIRSEGPMAERNPFRFSTKYQDDESGLLYYGLRYYDPHLGRFINRDPIEEQGGLNLYAAFNNDPVNTIDYLGMEPLSATIGNFLGRTLFNKVLGGIFGGGKQSLSSISYGDPRDIQYQRQNHMNVMADVARNHSFGYQDYLKATLGDLRKVLSSAETLGEYNEALGAVAKKLGTAVDKVQDFFNTTLGPIVGTDNVTIPGFKKKCKTGLTNKNFGKGDSLSSEICYDGNIIGDVTISAWETIDEDARKTSFGLLDGRTQGAKLQLDLNITEEKGAYRWRQYFSIENEKGDHLPFKNLYGIDVDETDHILDNGGRVADWYRGSVADVASRRFYSFSDTPRRVVDEGFFGENKHVQTTFDLEFVRVDDMQQTSGGDIIFEIDWGYLLQPNKKPELHLFPVP